MAEDTVTIRDKRTERRFFVDNLFVDVYGPIVGAYGYATYNVLLRYSNPDGTGAFPSQRKIAEKIGCSVGKVKETLKHLESLHLVAVVPRFRESDGGRTSNEYWILDPPTIPLVTTDTQGGYSTDTQGRVSQDATTNPPLYQSSLYVFPAPDGDGAPLKEGDNGRPDISDPQDLTGPVGDQQEADGGRQSNHVAPQRPGTTGGSSGESIGGHTGRGRVDAGRTGRQPPGNSVTHRLLSGTLTEGGNGDGRERQKWETPETAEQVDFLAVCGAKWFKPKQKAKVKAILTALRAGSMAGDDVYQKCMDAIADKAELEAPLPPMPQSWYDWREPQAKAHRWSVDGFINALLNRDGLVTHCQYHLRQKGAPTEATNDYGPDPMLMNMPGG